MQSAPKFFRLGDIELLSGKVLPDAVLAYSLTESCVRTKTMWFSYLLFIQGVTPATKGFLAQEEQLIQHGIS